MFISRLKIYIFKIVALSFYYTWRFLQDILKAGFLGKINACVLFSSSLYEIPNVSSSTITEDFGKLLREAEVMDTIHDVTFQVGTRTFPVHKYMLAMRSDFFRKLFVSDPNWLDSADLYRKDKDEVGCDLFVMEKLHPDLFMYLLQYIYTDSCDLLIHGYRPRMVYKERVEENEDNLITNLNKMAVHGDVNNKSAFAVYRRNQVQMMNEKQRSKSKSTSKKCKDVGEEMNLVKMLQIAAKKFGLSNLSSRYVISFYDFVCVIYPLPPHT